MERQQPWTEYNIDMGSDYSTLRANVIIPKITGLLSITGSGYIAQDVLRNPHKRTNSIYHRLMLGLSVSDIIYSTSAFVLTSWPIPRGYFIGAAGNVATCDTSAFFSSIGMFATPLYNCSLVTYYLLQLKYNWVDRKLRAIEKWLHVVPWTVGLGVGVGGLASRAFGPLFTGCWATQAYPIECTFPGSDVECIRGGNNQQIYFGVLYFLNVLLSILYVSISMFRVYRAVVTVERNSEKYSFAATTLARLKHGRQGEQERKRKRRKRSRKIVIQGVLYSSALVLISIFPLVSFLQLLFRTEEAGLPQIETCIAIFSPLQGFFNTFIYLMPIFQKMYKMRRERLAEANDTNTNTNHQSSSSSNNNNHRNKDSGENYINEGENGNVEEEQEQMMRGRIHEIHENGIVDDIEEEGHPCPYGYEENDIEERFNDFTDCVNNR